MKLMRFFNKYKKFEIKIKIKKIKAVLFVNYFGFQKDELKFFAKIKLKIIEDNSHLFAGILNKK